MLPSNAARLSISALRASCSRICCCCRASCSSDCWASVPLSRSALWFTCSSAFCISGVMASRSMRWMSRIREASAVSMALALRSRCSRSLAPCRSESTRAPSCCCSRASCLARSAAENRMGDGWAPLRWAPACAPCSARPAPAKSRLRAASAVPRASRASWAASCAARAASESPSDRAASRCSASDGTRRMRGVVRACWRHGEASSATATTSRRSPGSRLRPSSGSVAPPSKAGSCGVATSRRSTRLAVRAAASTAAARSVRTSSHTRPTA